MQKVVHKFLVLVRVHKHLFLYKSVVLILVILELKQIEWPVDPYTHALSKSSPVIRFVLYFVIVFLFLICKYPMYK